jgi:Dolichyl-phosphate-mannose-protein mannosyltransferase
LTGSLAGLLLANVLYLAIGVALLPLLRLARTGAELYRRLGLAYVLGLAATSALAAHLALIGVPVGLGELAVITLVVGIFGWRRYRVLSAGTRAEPVSEPLVSRGVGVAAFVVALVVLAHALRMFTVRPLVEWDGWAIWGMKARAIYDYGGVGHGLFTTQPYGPLQHPLLLPALEATGFRAMGAFDGTLIHVQLALLAFGFAAGLWTLLRERVPAALAGAAILAIVVADSTLKQLAGNLADIPLAFFVALGIVALARTLLDDNARLLPFAALMLGAATLTKPEGLLFAAAALVPFVLIARTRASLLTALAVALILVPWRIFVAIHGLKNPEYSLGDAVSPGYLSGHSARVRPAFWGVWHQVWSSGWGWLVPLALIAFAGVLLARRWRVAAFAAAWALLSFAGIVLVFWISVVPVELTLRWAGYRTVASLVIGAAALAPLLAAEAWNASHTSPSPTKARLGRADAHAPADQPTH